MTSVKDLKAICQRLNFGISIVSDSQKTISGLYGTIGTTTYIIIDKQGIVRYRRVGLDRPSLLSTMRTLGSTY